MTDTYCETCAEWTDPAILVDGDCPGCRAATVMAQAYPGTLKHIGASIRDITRMEDLDDAEPFTKSDLRERGFVEPEI